MTDIEQFRSRIVAQAMHVARLHTALSAIARAGGLTDAHAKLAQAALEACEPESGQILADLRTIMFSDNEPEFDPAWGRLEALLIDAGLVLPEAANGALPH